MADDTLTLPTATEPDLAGFAEIAAGIRRSLADPEGLFAKNPEAAARTEANLKAMMLRAGVEERPLTPEEIAENQHAAAWGAEMHPNLSAMLDERVEALEAAGEPVIRARTAALRAEIGESGHDRLIADAQAALNPGQSLPPAAKADLPTLKILAAHGRYCRAEEKARPNRR